MSHGSSCNEFFDPLTADKPLLKQRTLLSSSSICLRSSKPRLFGSFIYLWYVAHAIGTLAAARLVALAAAALRVLALAAAALLAAITLYAC